VNSLLSRRRPSRERLDEPDLSEEEMARSLEDLDLVNRLWGNARALAGRIAPRLRSTSPARFTLLDVGAGAATLSRDLARRLARAGAGVSVVALDLNWRHLAAGRTRCRDGRAPAVAADAFHLPFPDGSTDWIVSTLFFHHFSPSENVRLLKEFTRVARGGFALLDIRRSLLPLLFVSLVGRVVFKSRVSLEDGLASVRQAYTAEEARRFVSEALPGARVERVFPSRILVSSS
jgi:ubiquinone/menaquinone biosynthesis C-methylase UbiE